MTDGRAASDDRPRLGLDRRGRLVDSGAKNPVFVESGRRGARRRWGDTPRVVRLHELTNSQKRLVLALIDAARREAERDVEDALEPASAAAA